jgi:hypothetical protein
MRKLYKTILTLSMDSGRPNYKVELPLRDPRRFVLMKSLKWYEMNVTIRLVQLQFSAVKFLSCMLMSLHSMYLPT